MSDQRRGSCKDNNNNINNINYNGHRCTQYDRSGVCLLNMNTHIASNQTKTTGGGLQGYSNIPTEGDGVSQFLIFPRQHQDPKHLPVPVNIVSCKSYYKMRRL